MAISRRTGRSRFTLALLVLTSITVLTLDFRGSSVVTSARDGAATVFHPIRSVADTVLHPVGNVFHGISDYGHVKSENEKLQREIDALKGAAAQNADAARELHDIQKADGLPITNALPHVLARVVGGPVSNFDHTVEIGKGAGSGIKVGMPVVTGAGLVGRVIQVTGSSATVELITAPDFVLGVRLVHSGEIGVSQGTGEGHPLRVDSVSPDVKVPKNETVTTSEFARSIVPADIPVGTVQSVELSSDQREQLLTVKPIADLTSLSYVTVLLWQPPP